MRDRRVVAVVGTGVSLAASNGDEHASWGGLLKSGLDWCKDLPDNRLDDNLFEGLSKALDNPEPSMQTLLVVATAVETILRTAPSDEFGRWLRDTVGKIQVIRNDEITAIRDLDIPILTTNYDSILECGLNRERATWQQYERAVSVLSHNSDDILHLHGYWKDPRSVVLGAASYQNVADDTTSQEIKMAISGSCSFLFIGCGADGLSDPDLAPFFQWMATAWRGCGRRHFRLCTNDENIRTIRQIENLPYGNHDDLAGFLRNLAPKRTTTSGGS